MPAKRLDEFMSNKIKVDDVEIDLDDLSNKAKVALKALQFTDGKLAELSNMKALLQRSKNSYLESLKKEMLSSKSGLLFVND